MTADSNTRFDATPVAEWRLHPRWERAVIAVALAVIVLPGAGTLAGFGANAPTSERDATPPDSAGRSDGGVVAGVMTWARGFEDRFAFRDALVRGQAAVRYLGLGVSPQAEVIRGRDGWLFYADNGGLDDYLSVAPFSREELEKWGRTLQHTQDWLAARGIAYVFTIAPDKPQIYPEHMPTSLRPASPISRADQLFAHLAAHTTVHALDLRPALRAAKTADRLYHRTDSHWNDAGALVATREIVARLRRLDPRLPWDLAPTASDAFDRREIVAPGMDLARMLRLEGVLSEDRIDLVPRAPRVAAVVEPVHGDPDFGEARVVTRRRHDRGPRALVYRDSFGSALIPFLAEAFSQAVFLWEYDVDPSAVETERPDVVIHEWASRRLHTRMPYDIVAEVDRRPRPPRVP